MTITTVIQRAYSEAKGKATPPAVGTAKYNQLLLLADSLTKVWAAEPGVQWNSLYSKVSAGTIGAVSTIALPATSNYLIKEEGDPIHAISGTQRTDFKLVQPNELYSNRYVNAVAQAGRSLLFYEAFTSASPVFGWTLYVPSIIYPTDITVGADVVQVDDPMWLVFMMAAEFVRNDLVRQNQYPSLINYATESMNKMKQDNQSQNEVVDTPFQPLGVTWT